MFKWKWTKIWDQTLE